MPDLGLGRGLKPFLKLLRDFGWIWRKYFEAKFQSQSITVRVRFSL
jgi:hypothetical protein